MKMSPEKKMEEVLKDNRTHSGEPPGVTDRIEDTPSPGSHGMRILSRYSITVDTLMTAMEIACI
jgi:hypothetical protein